MKMILAVLVVRMIISLFEKNKKVTVEKKENRNRVIHPAEFEIRVDYSREDAFVWE